jgi:hypothetical protein
MYGAIRRLVAMGMGVAVAGALTLPASPASAAANVWTCDQLSVVEFGSEYFAVGVGNCTGGDPLQKLGGIATRNPPPVGPVQANCLLNSSQAPGSVNGRYCTVQRR